MQFLVYLTVLMVSISTVLLEVHWLTSPPPQPKPAVQAANVPTAPRKVEGPTAALSPVYPKPAETAPAPETTQTTTAATANAVQPQPQQLHASSNTPAAPAATETTGVAARAEDNKEPATATAVSAQAATSNNRCDVQACASAYQSFRAADCTYQPFEGPRRICEKAPGQRTARDQTERTERRQWSRDRDVAPRDSDRTIGRRVYDDPDESDADDDAVDAGRFSIFRARGPRW